MGMEKDKIEELLEARAQAELQLEKMRTPVTLLFSDIKNSTSYFEKAGDVEGLAMVERHNSLMMPVIEDCGGRVVKTMGDGIMASFADPVGAIRAAIGMQRALEQDRSVRSTEEHIHIRLGLHTGYGLVKEDDVFGDVVNTAARVQQKAQPDQILISDVLLDAARAAGAQCARLGPAEMKGKDERIDLYIVAWSEAAGEQIVEELQADFERKLKEARRQSEQLEEDLENARDQWRSERRRLTAEIEQLEEAVERARESARRQVSDDMQSEIRFQLEEAIRARQQAEEELHASQAKWESDRAALKTQISNMQASVIESMERSNNPTRMAMAVREQVEMRLKEAKEEWNLQWESERRRLNAEIERLKKAPGAVDERKETARRALLEKLGKLPAGSTPGAKSPEQWEKELSDARLEWETERDQLNLRIRRLESELRHANESLRTEIYQELHSQYEPRLAEANRQRHALELELESVTSELNSERLRSNERIEQLERAIPEAQEAVRKQLSAELQAEFEVKLEEATRMKSRSERRFQDAAEEWEAERRRLKRQVAQLEEQLKDARETAFRAQRLGGRPPAE